MDNIVIRNIKKEDDSALAKIIRETLTEFKANKAGTVFFDKTTDHLFETFQIKKAAYFVVFLNDVIIGGGGVYPTPGLLPDTCELVKMYLTPSGRGKGIGKTLIEKCVEEAGKKGYGKMYLETMPELTSAISLYKKFGFTHLPYALGNSGHNGCTLWMIKEW